MTLLYHKIANFSSHLGGRIDVGPKDVLVPQYSAKKAHKYGRRIGLGFSSHFQLTKLEASPMIRPLNTDDSTRNFPGLSGIGLCLR